MNKNPSFGIKHTEKPQRKLSGCSGALGYILTSFPEGYLAQEASVSRGVGIALLNRVLCPSDPRGVAGALHSCPA